MRTAFGKQTIQNLKNLKLNTEMAKDYQYKAMNNPFLVVGLRISGTAKNKKALCDTIRELIAEGFSDIHIKVIERE